MTYADIPGWFDYERLYDRIVQEAPPNSTLVEVGCWLGRSLAYLGAAAKASDKGLAVVGVDPGFGSKGMADESLHAPVLAELGGNTTTKLLCNLRDCGVSDVVTVIAAPSVQAARLLGDGHRVAFVFIDAAHDSDSVAADIRAWSSVLMYGGVLAGHDYSHHWPSVVASVDALLGRREGDPAEYPNADPTCPHCWSRRM